MKKKILALATGSVILATSIGISGVLVSETSKIAAKYGVAAGIFVLASMGLFFIGMVTPKD